VGPEQWLLVLKWQVIVAVLMGIEYFIPVKLRRRVNKFVKRYFQVVQYRVDEDVADSTTKFRRELPRLIVFAILLVVVCGLWLVVKMIAGVSCVLAIALLVFAVIFIISGMGLVFGRVFDLSKVLGLAAPFRVLTIFLVSSHRGLIAAFGFICLLVSFCLQWSYIVA